MGTLRTLREVLERKYPDGESIPKNLPPKYSLAKGKEKCNNCEYYVEAKKYCTHWKAEVRPLYWCAKWEPIDHK